MENENLTPEQENTVQNTPSPLHAVTPLSKYLAMLLFIVLPFLAGYIGYTYAPEKIIEVEKLVTEEKISNKTPNSSTTITDLNNCLLVVREIETTKNQTEKTIRFVEGAAQAGDLVIENTTSSEGCDPIQLSWPPGSAVAEQSNNLYFWYDSTGQTPSSKWQPTLNRLTPAQSTPEILFGYSEIAEAIGSSTLSGQSYLHSNGVVEDTHFYTSVIIHLSSPQVPDEEYNLVFVRYNNQTKNIETAQILPYSEQHQIISPNQLQFKEVTLLGSFAEYAGTDTERRIVSDDWTLINF